MNEYNRNDYAAPMRGITVVQEGGAS